MGRQEAGYFWPPRGVGLWGGSCRIRHSKRCTVLACSGLAAFGPHRGQKTEMPGNEGNHRGPKIKPKGPSITPFGRRGPAGRPSQAAAWAPAKPPGGRAGVCWPAQLASPAGQPVRLKRPTRLGFSLLPPGVLVSKSDQNTFEIVHGGVEKCFAAEKYSFWGRS